MVVSGVDDSLSDNEYAALAPKQAYKHAEIGEHNAN